MLKDKVKKVIDNGKNKLKKIAEKTIKVSESPMYTSEYKQQVINELIPDIVSIKEEVSKNVEGIFNNEINSIKNTNVFNGSDDLETSNILKMLELSKNAITEKEINYLADRYKDNGIVKKVLRAIAKEKNIAILQWEQFIPDTEDLEELRDSLVRYLTSDNEPTFYNNLTLIGVLKNKEF